MQICISSFFEYQLNESLQSANSVGLQTQYIFNRRCSIYSTADAVYIQLPMQYIFNCRCSIYSTADAVYIHFSGVYIGCLRAFICFLLYFR